MVDPTLAARVEAAEGPDRDLDLEIGFALAGWKRVNARDEELPSDAPYVSGEPEFLMDHEHGYHAWPPSPGQLWPSFTESLDAALGLVSEKLPDASIVIRKSPEGYWLRDGLTAGCWGVILNDNPLGWLVAATPALALLAALLRALEDPARG